MTRYHGGELVKAGFYWNPAGWEITTTKKGEALPGTKENRYLRIPTILLMVVGPLLGALMLVFLPLIGYTHRLGKITTLAVERIRKVERLGDHFTYPKRYSPAKYTQGMFGIIDGPRTRVELLLLNPETAAFLSSRRIHPTQRFRKLREDTTQLTVLRQLPRKIRIINPVSPAAMTASRTTPSIEARTKSD
jgi:WYL domain